MTTQDSSPRLIDLRTLPIAFKIALGLGLVLVLSAVVTDLVIRQVVFDAQRDVAQRDLEATSRTQAYRVVDALGQEIVTLNRLGSNEDVQEQLAAYAAQGGTTSGDDLVYQVDASLKWQVINFRETREELDTVALLDTRGHILAIDPKPEGIETLTGPGTWELFTSAYNNGIGQTVLRSPYDIHLTEITGVHMMIPIYSTQNPDQIVGMLYSIWNMSNAIDVVQPGGGREVLVTESDGTVLLSTTFTRGTVLSYRLMSEIRMQTARSFDYTDASGVEWFYGYTDLSDLGLGDTAVANLGWIVAARQTTSLVEAGAGPLLLRLRWTFGAGLAVATLFILLITRSVILAPLRRLTEAAASIEAGDLGTPIPELPADEMGRLALTIRGLVNQLLSRLRQLQAAVQVSRAAAVTLDVNQMLSDVTQTLIEHFDYPDVRIYLTDPTGKRAWLQAAAGGESDRLLRMGHRLAIDETTLIGRAILLNEPQLGGGKERLREVGLAMERSEVALPLRAGGHSLGALYVVAGRFGVLRREDVDILRLLADQLSASIENARLYEQSTSNLAEIEALNRRLTRQIWEEHIGEGQAIRHTLDPARRWPETPETLRTRGEVRAETYTDADGRAVMAVPLVLRGETVGSLAVTRSPGERWSADEMALLESVAARMAMIAESIRLVEESTWRAEREQRINEISAGLLQRAADVDSVLQSALNQLGGALGSNQVSLRIGPPPVEGAHQITSGTDGRAAADTLDDSNLDAALGPDDGGQISADGDGGESDA